MNTTPTTHHTANNRSSDDTATIVRLLPKDTEEASSVLAHAFSNYPITQYLFKEAMTEGPSRFQVMFKYLIDSRHVRHFPVFGCRIGSKLVGIAVVSEPGEGWSTPELEKRYQQATEIFGPIATQRFEYYGDICDETIPNWPHHYLGILGILPAYQKQGLGRTLVEAVKSEAAAHPISQGVCLHTEAASNLTFYHALGFETFASQAVDSIHTWCLSCKSAL